MNLPPRAQKLLPLALSSSAADGEWRNAAMLFFKILREEGITAGALSQEVRNFHGADYSRTPDYWSNGHDSAFTADMFAEILKQSKQRTEGQPSAWTEHVVRGKIKLVSGKYAGKFLWEVPLYYLQWYLRNGTNQFLRKHMSEEITDRFKRKSERSGV